MKKKSMGFILLLMLIIVNTTLGYVGIVNDNIRILDTFSWGFFTAVIMGLGLFWIFSDEEK